MWLNPAHEPVQCWPGRPLAWFDDDFDLYSEAHDALVVRPDEERAGLVPVDPYVGISEARVGRSRRG